MKYNYKYSLKELKNSKNQSFYELGKSLIPGGSQLLSKRPEMFALMFGHHITPRQKVAEYGI